MSKQASVMDSCSVQRCFCRNVNFHCENVIQGCCVIIIENAYVCDLKKKYYRPQKYPQTSHKVTMMKRGSNGKRFSQIGVEGLDLSKEIPDLSLIPHLWDEAGCRLQERRYQSSMLLWLNGSKSPQPGSKILLKVSPRRLWAVVEVY